MNILLRKGYFNPLVAKRLKDREAEVGARLQTLRDVAHKGAQFELQRRSAIVLPDDEGRRVTQDRRVSFSTSQEDFPHLVRVSISVERTLIFLTMPSPELVTIQSPTLIGRSKSRMRPDTKLLTID